MKEIEYFQNGGFFVAIAAGQFIETVIFCHYKGDRHPYMASISLRTGEHIEPDFYYQLENNYKYVSRESYLAARKLAQGATTEFFGEYDQFITPPDIDLDLMQGYAVQVNKR